MSSASRAASRLITRRQRPFPARTACVANPRWPRSSASIISRSAAVSAAVSTLVITSNRFLCWQEQPEAPARPLDRGRPGTPSGPAATACPPGYRPPSPGTAAAKGTSSPGHHSRCTAAYQGCQSTSRRSRVSRFPRDGPASLESWAGSRSDTSQETRHVARRIYDVTARVVSSRSPIRLVPLRWETTTARNERWRGMPDQPILLKVLLRERHWQHYATFCAEYDKAATRVDPDLTGTYPSRAQLHRWLSGALRGLPYPDHCRVLEDMLPGWTAEQLFQPATLDLLYTGAQTTPSYGTTPTAGPAGPPVFAAPSVGIRPFVEQAFAREHVTIDFAGFSGETLHGVVQEPLDKIRIGRIKPASVTIRMLLPDTTRPM